MGGGDVWCEERYVVIERTVNEIALTLYHSCTCGFFEGLNVLTVHTTLQSRSDHYTSIQQDKVVIHNTFRKGSL